MPTPPRDPATAASFGGPGWQPRATTHAEEVAAGRLWAPYRVRSEVAPLEAVLLAWPGQELALEGDPDAHLMLAPVSVPAIQRQAAAVAEFFRGQGVRVHLARPASPPPPNFIFQRDLFFMTPEGAVLGRPAGVQRAGEERFTAEALALAGVPILRTLTGQATFEGADALWLRPDLVLLGLGTRTNAAGADQVEAVLAEQGVTLRRTELPRTGVQHLLGVLTPVDTDLCLVHGGHASEAQLGLLRDLCIEPLVLPPGPELTHGRSNNVVALAPRRVVMPAGCPQSRALLEAHGVICFELDVGEYVKAAGALGCLTGVLSRAE
ncbi:MAG: arginine deiminase family protein [Pseudomonadota bacterium]